MLDLNVEVVYSDDSPSYCNIDDRSSLMMIDEEEEPNILEEDDEEEEEDRELSAGTSDSSSVVNADDPPPNAGDVNSSSPLIFGILKEGHESKIVTHQLFPTVGGAGESSQLSFGVPAFESRPQWLNLSFGGDKVAGPPAAAELRVLQQKQQQQVRKSRRGPRSRSSQYRGVTFYRRTGRWESHIWDCGKQVYLGGFDTAYSAARAYDRAAIKFRGVDADINFTVGDYDEDMKQMGNLSKEDFVHALRRQSTGAARGNLKLRGVTALRKCGRWEAAQMGQFTGKKAFIQFNGTEAVTHLQPRPYERSTILDVGTEGRVGVHNLDLNLCISTPSTGCSSKEAIGGSHVRPRQQELSPLGYGSYAAPPNHHPPIWSPMYPFLLPSSEGKSIMKKSVAPEVSFQSGWKVQSNNGSSSRSPMKLMFPNAASSGFSSSFSSITALPSNTLHLQQNLSLQNPNNSPFAKPANPNSFPSLYRN